MASPGIFPKDYGHGVSVNNHVFGPIVIACAVIGLHDSMRGLRWINLIVGIWLLIAPWVLAYNVLPTVNGMITGALLIGAALVKGRVCLRTGEGWKGVFVGGQRGISPL